MDKETLLRLQDLLANRKVKEAYDVVVAFLKSDPTDVPAWLWLSELTPSVNGKRWSLERALSLDPGNPAANRALSLLPSPPSQPTTPSNGVNSISDSGKKLKAVLGAASLSPPAAKQPMEPPPTLATAHATVNCPSCHATVGSSDLFCKSCGQTLSDTPPRSQPSPPKKQSEWGPEHGAARASTPTPNFHDAAQSRLPPERSLGPQAARHPSSFLLSSTFVLILVGLLAFVAVLVIAVQGVTSKPKVAAPAPTAIPRLALPTLVPTLQQAPPTARPSPTSALLLGSAKDYIPGVAELPEGFSVYPPDSGPKDFAGADGYVLFYINTGTPFGFPAGIFFTVVVHSSISAARDAFAATLAEFASGVGNEVGASSSMVPNDRYDQCAIYLGDDSTSDLLHAEVLARKKNVTAQVTLAGYGTTIDALERFRDTGVYYMNLVLDRLNP